MGQGDVPTSRGGPLRRRKEKRQLEHLAAASLRDGVPRASAAHVKLIGDEGVEGADTEAPTADRADADRADTTNRAESDRADSEPVTTGAPPQRPSGFHVRPVPIDQPVGGPPVSSE
jgi:hypothetical protein